MWQVLLQNVTATLLQSTIEAYYRTRQFFYYKMWQILHNATIITNFDSTLPRSGYIYWLIHSKLKIFHVFFVILRNYLTILKLG